MVRLHLLLPDVATRRDLDAPATVSSVARTVGTRELLELLDALTEADGLATGPMAWNAWKAALVGTLVARVDARLAGDEVVVPSTFPTDEQRRLMSHGQVAVLTEDRRLTVVAPDRPELVGRVAGALAVNGLAVLAAQAATEDGMAVQVYDVGPSLDREPHWDRVQADVERALAGRLPVSSRLAERISAYAGHPRPAAAHTPEPRVLFDNDGSQSATVVEVRAADGIGVLYRITRAFAECDVTIGTAKIATLGHEVVDTFYVVGLDGTKVTDPEQLDAIAPQILAEL
jgi:[protein-PII] uridylyltransferase